MRYVGLLVFFICIPLLIEGIKSNPTVRRRVWAVLGAAPYIYGWAHLSVSIVSWAYWPGYVKGMILALPDLLAIGLLLSTPKRRTRYSVMVALGCYIATVVFSMAVSELPFASFMYAWQLLRVLLVAAAVARVSTDGDAPRHIVYGMCCGIIFQAFFSITEHFGHGAIQASGTVGHQNLLGMMTHFVLLTSLALVLAGDRAIILKVGVAAALLTIALTGSRGTLGFAGGSVLALFALSLLRRPTAKKVQVAGAGIAVLLALAPVAYLTMEKRFAVSGDGGTYDERAAFERAAHAMWRDHPLGVGANEYVIIANTKGYSARAGVVWTAGSRSANVHNAYLLIAAETGWFGLVAFIFLYLVAIVAGIRAAWAKPATQHSELALGAVIALATVAIHSLYEWIFVLEFTQYLFGIMLGFVMGLSVVQVPRRSLTTIGDADRNRRTAVC